MSSEVRKRSAMLAVGLALTVLPLRAQPADGLPTQLEGVGITQHLDASLPLDTTFTDENGRPVELRDYFGHDRPILLALVYYRCPMLCNRVLDGMVTALRGIDLVPGRDFEIVTVSIDPREATELALLKKRSYVAEYGRPEAARGWHFLTGEPDAIESLADAVGFQYRFVPESGEYAHPAALYVVTPDGRLSRYLFGVRHEPRTVELSLIEAARGRIGTVVDQFLLYCYRYDGQAGSYVPAAWRIMRLGGVLTVLALGSAVGLLLWRERRERRWA